MDTETFTAETRQKVTSYLVQDAVKWLLGVHDNKAMSALSGLIRHVLTATGTFGAIHGTLTSDQVMQITGIVVAALPAAVSVARHWSVEILARIDAIINRRALPPSGPSVPPTAVAAMLCCCLAFTGCSTSQEQKTEQALQTAAAIADVVATDAAIVSDVAPPGQVQTDAAATAVGATAVEDLIGATEKLVAASTNAVSTTNAPLAVITN